MKRTFLALVLGIAVLAPAARPATAAEPSLTIGSTAPALDIEHYFHEKDQKVTKFEDGKVYVVEFWATWCPPCVSSMPHLAKLQEKHRKDNVQIVSVSTEDVKTITTALAKPHPTEEKPMAEVTENYTLTCDPDGSVSQDYMRAAQRNGIPCAFIVGKTGVVEWIGHPMSMDDPLNEVITDKWDRIAFKKAFDRERIEQEMMQKFNQLTRTGKFDDARAMIKDALAGAEEQADKDMWQGYLHRINLMQGTISDEDLAYFRNDLKQAAGDPIAVYRAASNLYGAARGTDSMKLLADDLIKAMNGAMDDAEPNLQVAFYARIAYINADLKKWDEAEAAVKQAMDATTSTRQKQGLEGLLKQFEAAAKADQE